MTVPVLITVHLPITIAVGVLLPAPAPLAAGFPSLVAWGTLRVLCRSPRRWTSAMMTVRPPSVMFAVPVMAARRETLLPESCGWVC